MVSTERQVKRLHVCCKCMLSSEKWAEMPAQIAFDLLQFMQVSHILYVSY